MVLYTRSKVTLGHVLPLHPAVTLRLALNARCQQRQLLLQWTAFLVVGKKDAMLRSS